MPIADISDVTRTIIELIKREVGPLEGDDPSTVSVEQFEVTAVPPDDSTDNPRRVSVHLLHLLETPEFRNIGDGTRRSKTPVQQLPMGLVLQYVLSVAPVDPNDADAAIHALAAQRILGRIARALHDFTIITPSTLVGTDPTPVLQGELLDAEDSLELILRPAPLQETFGYWATQNQRLPRACLFLEVRVVMLQQKPPKILPGIVLSVGNFIFANSGPQLLGSHSTISFVHPVSGNSMSISAVPARVALLPGGGSSDEGPAFDAANPGIVDNALLVLDATGLGPGKRFLALRGEKLQLKIALDDPPPANASWKLKVLASSISLYFRRSVTAVSVDPPQNLSVPVDLLPGIYSARVIVEDDSVGGLARPRGSNEIAFAVGPQITAVTTSGANTYTLKVPGKFLTSYTTNPPAPPAAQAPPEIQLALGGTALVRVSDGASLAAGQFQRVIESATETNIKLVLPTGVSVPSGADSPLPIQLLVAGVPAPPAWITGEEGP